MGAASGAIRKTRPQRSQTIDPCFFCAYDMRIHFKIQTPTMNSIFDRNAPKKPTNLSINSDLLEKAKNCRINLSQTLEHALAAELSELTRKQWLEANKSAIEALNRHTEKYGLFSDTFRDL